MMRYSIICANINVHRYQVFYRRVAKFHCLREIASNHTARVGRRISVNKYVLARDIIKVLVVTASVRHINACETAVDTASSAGCSRRTGGD